MHGRPDEIGDVVNDLKLNSRRQLGAQFLHLASYVVRHAHGVHARLPENVDGHNVLRGNILSEQCGPGAQLLRSVFHLGNVPHAYRGSSARADHDFTELFRGGHAPQRAQPQLLRSGDHAPARRFDVFPLQSIADVQHRKIVLGKLLGIEQNADLPALPPIQVHAAHAVHGLNRAPHLFVRDFRQLPAAHRPAHEQREDRIRLRVLLGDDRRQRIPRQAVDRSGHFLANILRRAIDIAFQDKGARDICEALKGIHVNFVDAADGRDGILQR